MQGLLARVSAGVTVEIQRAESTDLIQQLDGLRQTSVMLLDKNQNEFWFDAQVDKHPQHAVILRFSSCKTAFHQVCCVQVSALSSPEVTFGPPEVVQAELLELRRTATSLEEELTQLQTLVRCNDYYCTFCERQHLQYNNNVKTNLCPIVIRK